MRPVVFFGLTTPSFSGKYINHDQVFRPHADGFIASGLFDLFRPFPLAEQK
jgi:hypothetical protein